MKKNKELKGIFLRELKEIELMLSGKKPLTQFHIDGMNRILEDGILISKEEYLIQYYILYESSLKRIHEEE